MQLGTYLFQLQIADVLDIQWQKACGTELTEEHKNYLASKAFRSQDSKTYIDSCLSWSLFGKEPLPDHKFTFWEWFHSMLSLTQQHMQLMWKKEHIMGFVEKDEAKNLLLQQPEGTFLLRFSDSTLGGVTVAYRNADTCK